MIGSPGSEQWLQTWKMKAEAQRQWLTKVLAQTATTPTTAWKRQLQLGKAQSSVQDREKWAGAYHDHLKELARIFSGTLGNTEAPPKASLGKKGSLGD